MPFVKAELDGAVKNGTPFDKLAFLETDLVGPWDSSRLDPLLTTLRETGFPFLTSLIFSKTPVRNMDMMVLVSCHPPPLD